MYRLISSLGLEFCIEEKEGKVILPVYTLINGEMCQCVSHVHTMTSAFRSTTEYKELSGKLCFSSCGVNRIFNKNFSYPSTIIYSDKQIFPEYNFKRGIFVNQDWDTGTPQLPKQFKPNDLSKFHLMKVVIDDIAEFSGINDFKNLTKEELLYLLFKVCIHKNNIFTFNNQNPEPLLREMFPNNFTKQVKSESSGRLISILNITKTRIDHLKKKYNFND